MKQIEIYFFIQNIFNYLALGILALITIIGAIKIIIDIWKELKK